MNRRIAYIIHAAGQTAQTFARSPQEAAKAYAVRAYGRQAQAWRAGSTRNREVFAVMVAEKTVAAIEVRPAA